MVRRVSSKACRLLDSTTGGLQVNHMRNGTETRGSTALAEYRMAAWWWWSVPYSIVCPLLTMLLDPEKYNAHTIMFLPLTYLFFSSISSMLWTVVAVYNARHTVVTEDGLNGVSQCDRRRFVPLGTL
jgi:hypothetical protein